PPRGKVSKETAFRARLGLVDGRNPEARAGGLETDANRHLRNCGAALKKYFPNADSATLSDKHKVTAAVLDKLAEQHPDDATVVGYAKEVVGEATDFVRSHNLVTIPDTPLDVIAMPEFKRAVPIAYYDPPGPLEKNGKTFFAVAPTPKDW